MGKKPTIDEIIKGLDNLSYYHDEKGVHECLRGAIALIQDQKAEIERLAKLSELRLRDSQDTCKLLIEKEEQVDELTAQNEWLTNEKDYLKKNVPMPFYGITKMLSKTRRKRFYYRLLTVKSKETL